MLPLNLLPFNEIKKQSLKTVSEFVQIPVEFKK
jgi:hypothetical protein